MVDKVDLFSTAEGRQVTTLDVIAALENVDAHKADVLFIHTELSFGTPVPGLKRAQLLGLLYECIQSLGVATVCLPTFTFSFCNGLDYDVQTSRSQMGALNEFIRQLPSAVRSVDPLMSVAMVGRDQDLVTNLGRSSCGKGSTFDKLHHRERVKFLFFGTRPAKCMTYTHYVEEMLAVPYRYHRPFTGKVRDRERETVETYDLFVRYHGVVPVRDDRFERELIAKGLVQVAPLGQTEVLSLDERVVYREVAQKIERDRNYFLDAPFDASHPSKEFAVQNMVAL